MPKLARSLGLLLIVFAAATTGCASVINGTTQEIGFRSVPSGATVSVSGQAAATPTTLKLSRDKDHTATFKTEGQPDRQTNLKQKLSGAFFGNLLLGGLIGMVVDMSNGAAYNLSPENIEMDMGTGLVREFNSSEPIRTAEAPAASPLAYQAAPAVAALTAAPTAAPPPRELPVVARDSGLRYIAPNKGGGGFVLWTSLVSFNNCIQAITRGTEQSRRQFCEDGVSGVRPKVGDVGAGTEVELLDSKECGGEMTHIRVLSGPYMGETGCLAPMGLSRVKAG